MFNVFEYSKRLQKEELEDAKMKKSIEIHENLKSKFTPDSNPFLVKNDKFAIKYKDRVGEFIKKVRSIFD